MSEEPATKKSRVDEVQAIAGSSEGGEGDSLYDVATQKALEEIDSCQNELDQLTEKASEEILKVEQKFNTMRKPFFGKRCESIQKIQSFWLAAFVNHPQISAILEEEEEDCLQFLNKVEVEEHEDIKSGYSIKLHFNENPYFTNDLLVKEFNLANQGDPISSATAIKWKEGKSLVDAKKRSKGRGALHVSFFSWFLDTSEPATDDIAEVIKDDMWPNPLQYYLGGTDDGENGLNDDSVVTIDDDDDEEDDDVEEIDDVQEIEDEDEEDEGEDS